MTTQEQRLEDILEGALERVRGGEPLDAVLRDHGAHADELHALLAPAAGLARAQAPDAAPGVRLAAMTRMQAELETQRAAREAPGGLAGLLAGWRGRSLAFRAFAVVGAVALFGGAGLGASAATGNTPEPVRALLRIPSDSTIKVELEGVLVSVDGSAIEVEVDGQQRLISLTSSTEFRQGRAPIGLADLLPGDLLEIKARLLDDDSIVALQINREDAAGAPPEHAPGPPPGVPGGGPPTWVPRGTDENGQPDGVPRGSGSDDWPERLPEPAQTAIAGDGEGSPPASPPLDPGAAPPVTVPAGNGD